MRGRSNLRSPDPDPSMSQLNTDTNYDDPMFSWGSWYPSETLATLINRLCSNDVYKSTLIITLNLLPKIWPHALRFRHMALFVLRLEEGMDGRIYYHHRRSSDCPIIERMKQLTSLSITKASTAWNRRKVAMSTTTSVRLHLIRFAHRSSRT